MAVATIILETARLRLREFTLADAPYIVTQLNDPLWLRFIGERNIRNDEDARGYLATRLLDAYARHGFGFWATETRDDGVVVGMCGLIRRTGLDDVDLGFALLPQYRHAGYAFEAAQATLAHGHGTLGLARIVAITAPANARCAHLLRAIGMRYERNVQLPEHGGESMLFSSTG